MASATELSCFSQGSSEGEQQLDLAAQWRRAYKDTQDQVEQGQRVWINDGKDVIYQDSGSSSTSSMRWPAAYLLPHVCPQRVDRVMLLYHRRASTVSFFTSANKLICYLLVNHEKGAL